MGNLGWSVRNSVYHSCQVLFSEISSSLKPSFCDFPFFLLCVCEPCSLMPVPCLIDVVQRGCQPSRALIPGALCWFWTLRFGVPSTHLCLDHPRRAMRSQIAVNRTRASLQTWVFLVLQGNKKFLLYSQTNNYLIK